MYRLLLAQTTCTTNCKMSHIVGYFHKVQILKSPTITVSRHHFVNHIAQFLKGQYIDGCNPS